MPADNTKIISNGYTRQPYIMKNNGHGGVGGSSNGIGTADDDGGGGGGLGAVTGGGGRSSHALSQHYDASASPLLGGENNSELSGSNGMHPSTQPQYPNNVGHKFDTHVSITGGGGGGGGSQTTLERGTTIGYTGAGNTRRNKSLRKCQLLVLAVALTVLGAAIGALAINFAGSYRCQTTHNLDNNQNFNITGEWFT